MPDRLHRTNLARTGKSWHVWKNYKIGDIPADEYAKARTSILLSRVRQLKVKRLRDHYAVELDAEGGGSAVAISSDGYFLTAAHCVRKDASLLVGCWDKENRLQFAKGRLVWRGDRYADIAVVHAPVRTRFFELADLTALPSRAAVSLTGMGRGQLHKAGGHLISVRSLQRDRSGAGWREIIHSAPTVRGDSGGPLMSQDGKLLGVLSGGEVTFMPLPFLPLWNVKEIAISPQREWIERLMEQDRWQRR